MYHTLQTLHDKLQRSHPALVGKFSDLKTYCYSDSKDTCLNQGFNSLKWLIYALRDEISPSELEQVFFYLLLEANFQGEDKHRLYGKILEFETAKRYEHLIVDRPQMDYEVRNVNGWKIAINNTPKNLTSLIMKRANPDIIVAANPEIQSGAVIFSEKAKVGKVKVLDIAIMVRIFTYIFLELSERDSGKWEAIANNKGELNLIVCGGKKASHNTTKLDRNSIYGIVRNAITSQQFDAAAFDFFRARKGFSVDKIGKEAGLSSAYLGKIIREGLTFPSQKILAVCERYGYISTHKSK